MKIFLFEKGRKKMIALGLVLGLFFVGAHSIYQEFYSQDLNCSGPPTVRFVPNRACDTEAGGATGACLNFLNLTGTITSCPETVVMPPNWASIQAWASTTTCSGFPDYTIALPPNRCSGYWGGPTMQLDCATNSIKECEEDSATCEHCPSRPADARGICAVGNPTLNLPIASYIFTCPPRHETCGLHEPHEHEPHEP